MEWISVEDELPKGKNQWGSCWWQVVIKGKIPTSAIFSNGNWYIQASGGGTYKANVSHWMPLPDLPIMN